MSEEQEEYKMESKTLLTEYKENQELKYIEKERIKINRKIKKLESELRALLLWENNILKSINK